MIIAERVKDLEIVGEHDSKKAKISVDKMKKLQYLLTKGLYKDPITAVIAEWTNNGVDGVVQAGKNSIENPVMVNITKNDRGAISLSVEDKGCGLDDRDFEDICMNYLESTKENDNDTIGHFGIGMKSFLSLERSATFTCRKGGIERKYLVYEGDEFVNFDLIHQKDTKEENGVLAELVIKDWGERELFVKKAKSKLAYYDTAVLVIDGVIVKNDIHRHPLFQYSSLNSNSQIHIALKDVYYTIDYEALGIQPINLPIAIRLGLGDGLTPTPSRESYITNDKVRTLLLEKIKGVADWFVKKYNEKVTEFPTFMEAYPYIGKSDYVVPLEDRDFTINPLLKYASFRQLEIQIKGVTKRTGDWYKSKKKHLVQEYSPCVHILPNGKRITKSHKINKDNLIFDLKKDVIVVGDDYKGNVREYLSRKYGADKLYVRKNSFTRSLGGKVENKRYADDGEIAPDSYYNIVELSRFPKQTWRDYIKEWQLVVSTTVSTFKDETNVATTKDYLDWLEKKRESQKMSRASGYISGSYTGLNKQAGDVTIAYAYERYGKIHFKKDVYPISSLKSNKYLTIIVSDGDVELAKSIMERSNNPNVKFARIGKLERKRIPESNQFITFKQYISMDSKPFMRLASSILFNRTVGEFEDLSKHKGGVFELCLKSFVDDVKKLEDFANENFVDCGDEPVESMILQVAQDNNLFDMQLWDVYKRVQNNIKKYDFVNLLEQPKHTDTETMNRYNALINQVLLFRKKKYDDLEGATIIFKTKTETDEMVQV
jgi:hypothetical protein